MMKELVVSLIIGLLIGIIPFGLIEVIGRSIPVLKENFYDNPKQLIFGYHIHHSVLGLLSITWGIYSVFQKLNKPFFWIGLGLGMIIIHTIADGRLVFIEKQKK